MSQDLNERLRRLGLTKGARHLKPAQAPRESAHTANRHKGDTGDETLQRHFPGGRLEESPRGACFVVDHVYALDHPHGGEALSTLFGREAGSLAAYCKEPRLRTADLREFVFLDTETTGLHGASTLAFLVGIGFYEENSTGGSFIVRQYFLRDHDDESAMLHFLEESLAQRSGLITFNGQSFDLTLLENRYVMNRQPVTWRQMQHIDLLPLSRRLWRRRLGSVALSNLEKEILGLQREEADVPGWMIPTIYNDYLRSRDAGELLRVFYHNEIDILTMVTLANRLITAVEPHNEEIHPEDLFSVGKWQADLGLLGDAERTLSNAVSQDLPLPTYHQTLEQLALLLKRQERYEEALPLWKQWAATTTDRVDPFVELAKYFEWRLQDLESAESWTRRALALIDFWPASSARLVRPELEHRLERLRRKLVGA